MIIENKEQLLNGCRKAALALPCDKSVITTALGSPLGEWAIERQDQGQLHSLACEGGLIKKVFFWENFATGLVDWVSFSMNENSPLYAFAFEAALSEQKLFVSCIQSPGRWDRSLLSTPLKDNVMLRYEVDSASAAITLVLVAYEVDSAGHRSAGDEPTGEIVRFTVS